MIMQVTFEISSFQCQIQLTLYGFQFIIALLSMNSFQQSKEPQEPTFNKGMTLEQYMSGISFGNSNRQAQFQDDKQQNLFESSHLSRSQICQPKGNNNFIQEVDQESVNQSLDDRTAEFHEEHFKEQTTKETFRQVVPLETRKFVKKSREDKMRNTAYFNNIPHEKHNFRVKHMSNSPARKKTEQSVFNGTLTLYGQKFGLSKGKEEKKVQQMVTFYGKMPKGQTKLDGVKKQSKRNFKNRGHLELNELIDFQTRIKNNFSQKIYMKDLRVEGLKDRFNDRKNKFC